MRKTALDMVYQLAKKDERIIFIGSDLGVGTLKEFKKEMPERFLMEGVSEQNIIGIATGFALEGKIVYVNTIATFLTRRCFEQNVLDLGLHNANVRLIGNGGGVVYAPLGPTHLAIEDIAIMRTIPNMSIIVPADANEMMRVMPQTVNHKGPIYIRVAKGNDPIVTPYDEKFHIGKANLIHEGKDVLVITTGITLGMAKEALEILKEEGIEISILHVPTIKPLDEDFLIEMIKKVSLVVTIEEHIIIGGLGSAVAEIIAERFSSGKKFARVGFPNRFPEGYGSQLDMMARENVSTKNLVSVIKQKLLKEEKFNTTNMGV